MTFWQVVYDGGVIAFLQGFVVGSILFAGIFVLIYLIRNYVVRGAKK